jgi:hypothetical protein
MVADRLARIGHRQPVENIGRLVYRGRDGLGSERGELVGDMGLAFSTGSWPYLA